MIKNKNKESEYIEISEQDINKPFFLIKMNNNKSELVIVNEFFENKLSKKFKKFDITYIDYHKNDEEIPSVSIIGNSEAIEILNDTIQKTGFSVWESLIYLNDEFKINIENLKKFRGDLGEAIFLNKIGGEKIRDGETVDIKLDSNFIEVKTFSTQLKTVHITFAQIIENSKKYAVQIKINSDGMDIIKIAEGIRGNSEFKKYIKDKYENSEFIELKYDITTPVVIDSVLPTFNYFKYVTKADFIISIASLV